MVQNVFVRILLGATVDIETNSYLCKNAQSTLCLKQF
jgi:hypothetical protein